MNLRISDLHLNEDYIKVTGKGDKEHLVKSDNTQVFPQQIGVGVHYWLILIMTDGRMPISPMATAKI